MAELTETYLAVDRETWRAWLAERAAGTREIWLLLAKKGSGAVSVTYDEAVEEALCYGWIDGTARKYDEAFYAVRFTPRKPGSVWAESNVARVEKLIREGRMTEAGMRLVEDARRSGAWDQAASGRLAVTPPDLEEALAADPRATARWETWAASHRRQYIYWVLEAKRPETRARRVAEVVRRAAAGLPPGRRE
jgi:uncharacterized protein YdeI (YjbR/CyaY-like superfamily)